MVASSSNTSNFQFLENSQPLFFQLATTAESSFQRDPNTTLIKLRQLGEAITKDIASNCGISFSPTTKQIDLLYLVNQKLRLDPVIKSLFHKLRVEGNKATHEFQTAHREALDCLKVARELALWYYKSIGGGSTSYHPGKFISPADPSQQLCDL